jgi:glycosyltransferase involved in cell wall biosynthesis
MRVVVATTTGFHLRRIVTQLFERQIDTRYFSYMPRFRLRREGIPDQHSASLFRALLPTSFNALNRRLPKLQEQAVEAMFARTDDYIARHLPPCDVFIGLSAMAVHSAEAARRQGATVIIERGSRHVVSQNALLVDAGGAPLSRLYLERELASYAAADYISLLSGHAVQSFVDEGFDRDRLFLNPLGVDLDTFAPSPRREGPTRLLFIGAWSRRKGADLLAKAMTARPDWHLSHAGTITDMPFPDLPNVRSFGHRNHRQLAELMKEHHILVLPSREDGFGMVMLEGLAAGLPVVASEMTGGPDIRAMITDKHAVEIHAANDVDALLAALDRSVAWEATSDPSRQRMTAEDRARFGWSAYGDRYVAFLQAVVGRSAPTMMSERLSR